MTDTLKRYATPLITGLFLISLISGAALFFHLGTNIFREMHEWLSMVLIVPFVLHLWKNWRSMLTYVGRTPFKPLPWWARLQSPLVFGYQTGAGNGERRPPQFAFSHAILGNAPSKISPLLGVTTESLVDTLKGKGFTAATADMALTEIATKSGKDEFELVAALLRAKP